MHVPVILIVMHVDFTCFCISTIDAAGTILPHFCLDISIQCSALKETNRHRHKTSAHENKVGIQADHLCKVMPLSLVLTSQNLADPDERKDAVQISVVQQ